MIKSDWHAKPLSSEEEVEQVRGVFHITCRPNIKGDNIPSCVAVAAAHQLIWRTHPENWAADGRPPPGRMQHNDRVPRAHWTLGLKLVLGRLLLKIDSSREARGGFVPTNFLKSLVFTS